MKRFHQFYQNCELIVYRCHFCPPDDDGYRHFVIDCERHSMTGSIDLFSGALGMALMHRFEASRASR